MFDPVKQEVEEHGADGFKNRFITNLSTVSLNARVIKHISGSLARDRVLRGLLFEIRGA